MNEKKIISVIAACYNEEENIEALCNKIIEILSNVPKYDFEIILIDNKSKDKTREIIKKITSQNTKIKAIFNARNFGHIRSPMHAFCQATGDIVVIMASDFQDPPELILDLINKYEQGYKIVKCVKTGTKESFMMANIRKLFYNFISKLSDIELTKNFTGFGLYDREIVEVIKKIDDPYPYFRGLLSDIGFDFAIVEFTQPTRKRGITKNNFYTLYDIAMLGIINHSKLPLRLTTMLGFLMSILSIVIAVVFLIVKLLFWYNFQAGMAPILIGMFILGSIQLFCIGILGEYIGTIFTQVQKRPLVIEEKRINFNN